MNTVRTAQVLGYAGLIPFVVLALDILVVAYFGPIARLCLLAYGAVILSFLGGTIWGRCLREPEAGVSMIVSILPSLAGWFAVLQLGSEAFWIVAAGVAATLAWDIASDLPPWFRRLRIHLSIGAILAMIVGALT